jgi:predicted nuclease of predicted toxin-antitoxin system
MRLLLDTCIWGGATHALRTSGHDVIWSGDWDEDPGDEEILAIAYAEGRVLVTLDKDFGELAVVRGHPIAALFASLASRREGKLESCRSS